MLRYPSALPPLDRSARLPLVLSALLLSAVAVQLADGGGVDLPPSSPMAPGPAQGPAIPQPRFSEGGREILARSVFAPSLASTTGPAGPAGDRKIVGSIRIGRAAYVVVQSPDGSTANVPLGARIGDWRLAGIRPDGVRLERGEESIIAPFGTGVPSQAKPAVSGSPT